MPEVHDLLCRVATLEQHGFERQFDAVTCQRPDRCVVHQVYAVRNVHCRLPETLSVGNEALPSVLRDGFGAGPLPCLRCHLPQSSSASRFTVDTMPSQPSAQACRNTTEPSSCSKCSFRRIITAVWVAMVSAKPAGENRPASQSPHQGHS